MSLAAPAPDPLPPTSEPDDEVVHEIDVFVMHGLGKLLLTQYPLRPTYKGYTNRENVRVKPVNRELELEMKLQSTPNQPQQTQKLSVHQRPLIKPNSAIGFLKSRKLHLCPLDSVIQMTPSFDHIDKKVAEEAKLNTKVEKPEAAAVQSVTRRVMRVETDREKTARLASYNNIETERQKESWIPCDYRPLDHPYTQGCRRSIMRDGTQPPLDTLSREDYMKLLIPRTVGDGATEQARLPAATQVEQLLKNAHVLSEREVCDALPGLEPEVVEAELMKCGHLIQVSSTGSGVG
eukprot:sb/3467586/